MVKPKARAASASPLGPVCGAVETETTLALPMKPLCSEGCKGLCPQCGTNLNAASCDCSPAWKDPRLARLQVLLDRNKESH